MSDRKCYFCGPDWFPVWVRRILSKKHNASCRVHDMDYSIRSPYSRLDADLRFYGNMVRQSGKSVGWKALALFQFIAVRVLGWYNYRKRP